MIKNLFVCLLVLGFFTSLVHADVGPSPSPPKITIHLVNENGAPETSIDEIVYHCMSVETGEDNALAPTPMSFDCINGACTNDAGWYYKFNPCFDFPSGYFSYELNGVPMKTATFTPTPAQSNYEITFNAKTGEKTGSSSSSGCCVPAFILLGLVGAVIIKK